MGLLVHNWQRKLVAVLIAVIVWQYVNHSFLETKTLSNVPVKIVNLPPGRTVGGMLSNGVLGKRITLTLTGTKKVIEKLEPGDFEVQVDASGIHNDEWILQVNKSNLVSLNPSLNLNNHITNVSHKDFILSMSRLVTDKIPITVLKPKGEAPSGFQFLDIWPQRLLQSVTGPERDITEMKAQGVEIAFNLDAITVEELNRAQSHLKEAHDDEVSYLIPNKWKTVELPFYRNPQIKEINDPYSQNLRIDFLREQLLPVGRQVPIRIYYADNYRKIINPETYPLKANEEVEESAHIHYLKVSLFARHVSKTFLDLVKDHLELAVIAVPKEDREHLEWSLQIINPNKLEDIYTAYWLNMNKNDSDDDAPPPPQNEKVYRKRFRAFTQKLKLYIDPDTPLHLRSHLEEDGVYVHVNR